MDAICRPCLTGLLAVVLGVPALGQTTSRPSTLDSLAGATHVVVPQTRGFSLTPNRAVPLEGGVEIQSVAALVEIRELAAATTLEITMRNPLPAQAEAVMVLPVPDGAVISMFEMGGGATAVTAEVLGRDDARTLYESIVNKILDPALLEFAGYNLIRSSVFPIPPGGTQTIRLRYEHLLVADGNRIDYVLPRSESLSGRRPWRVTVELQSAHAISTVYSPSHLLIQERKGPGRFSLRVADVAAREPGPFRLSYLLDDDGGGVSASLFAYPDEENGGGYFLLMAGLPAVPPDDARRLRREVTVVIDKSGSMAGPKMDQARAAALQVVEGLADGEAFNIIDYSTAVSAFAPAPVVKDREATLEVRAYLDSIRPGGGTNIYGALARALEAEPTPGTLPIVLFLTDGLPTIGRTGEVDIRRLVETQNVHDRRIFTIGVGEDVNVPMLDRIADMTRAIATYVAEEEDVEVKVAQVFRRLSGPVFAEPVLRVTDTSGAVTTRIVHEIIPDALPDLFEDDRLIILGKYRDGVPLTFTFSGNYLGETRSFPFSFDLGGHAPRASAANSFVPRLWASRRIAFLVDAIRQSGAESGQRPLVIGRSLLDDPKHGELVDEILRLSTEFGILTEYTAFLAREGTDLTNWRELQMGCGDALDRRAVRTRSGKGAINQSMNYQRQRNQSTLNYRNAFLDAELAPVEIMAVQHMSDRAFFWREWRWVDSRLLDVYDTVEPDQVIIIGSPEHTRLARRFALEGRQGVLAFSKVLLELDGRVVLISDGC